MLPNPGDGLVGDSAKPVLWKMDRPEDCSMLLVLPTMSMADLFAWYEPVLSFFIKLLRSTLRLLG